MSLRALGATAALASCLALAACGGDDGKALNQAQYKSLDKVFETRVALEALPRREFDPDKNQKAAEPFITACNVLRADELLVSVRQTCGIPAAFDRQVRILGLCSGQQQLCNDAVQEIRTLLARFIREGGRADDAIDALGLSEDCADAIKPPEVQYEIYRAYGRVFTALQEAQEAQSKAGAARAQKMFEEANGKADELPSAKDRLEAFREACNPA